MIDRDKLGCSTIPFDRRWHVVHEIDLAGLVARHAEMAALCDGLEAMADVLPGLPSAERLAMLCAGLAEVACGSGCEDDHLGAMFADPIANRTSRALLARLRGQHLMDVACAQELLAAFEDLDGRQSAPDAALGYLLRCYFDGCRRTMDVEELAILHLADRRLTEGARRLLLDSLEQRAAA